MSNNLRPLVQYDNDRAMTYVNEFKASGLESTREFVKMFYSAELYAEQLLKGILK
jgi:hypothetical protein